MNISVLNKVDIRPLEKLLIEDKEFIPVRFEKLKEFSQEAISLFCLKYALYQIPTKELIDFISDEIQDEPTIELAAGNGCIGRALQIPMLDNYMQTWPQIMAHYHALQQPLIKYGTDVINLDGNVAVRKYKPLNVVACWLTQKYEQGMKNGNVYGVDELEMFDDGIKKYIHIGNQTVHRDKKLFKHKKYKVYKFPWLISRSEKREDNEIYIFTNR